MTQPFFIVSSGRSGTKMMEKLLGERPSIEMHHEYLCTHIQPLAIKYYMGLIDEKKVRQNLKSLHGAAIEYSSASLWGDSSNKLSWIIEILADIFPKAKFIHLVRDGRKVVSSYYHKLGNECYDDESVTVLQAHVTDPYHYTAPPPEKRFWWPLPNKESKFFDTFQSYDQFQRICFHWAEINHEILKQLNMVEPSRKLTIKLEELVKKPELVKKLLSFIGVEYQESDFKKLQSPYNVNAPKDFLLSDKQIQQFNSIASDLMEYFGYSNTEEYRVIYHPK